MTSRSPSNSLIFCLLNRKSTSYEFIALSRRLIKLLVPLFCLLNQVPFLDWLYLTDEEGYCTASLVDVCINEIWLTDRVWTWFSISHFLVYFLFSQMLKTSVKLVWENNQNFQKTVFFITLFARKFIHLPLEISQISVLFV